MKWHKAMLGGYPLIYDDRYFIPQHIVICQIYFPYLVDSNTYLDLTIDDLDQVR
jgi:hypothetical protein